MGFLSGIKIKRWIANHEVDPLMEQFRKAADKKKNQTGKDLAQQKEIVLGLGKIGNERAAERLEWIAMDYNRKLKINQEIQLLAIEALGNIHSAAGLAGLQKMVQYMYAGSVRKAAIKTLLDTKGDEGVQALALEFLHAKKGPREDILNEVVGRNDPELFKILVPGLQDEDFGIYTGTLKAFLRIPTAVQVEDLLPLVADGNSTQKEYAFQILDKKGWQPQDRELVLERASTLKDASPLVTMGKENFGELQGVLNELNVSQSHLINISIEALEEIGSSQAVDALLGLFEKGITNIYRLAESLGKIGSPQAVDILIGFLKEKERIHPSVVSALGKIGSPAAEPAVEILLELLKEKTKGNDSESKSMMHAIVVALDMIGNPKARPGLVAVYKHHDYEPALWTLYNHQWEMEFVVSHLIRKITEGEKTTREQCAQALVKLYQVDEIPQSTKNRILQHRETILEQHQDETWKEVSSHSDNGVSKTRNFDCTHDDYTYYKDLHTDKGVGVEFPLV